VNEKRSRGKTKWMRLRTFREQLEADAQFGLTFRGLVLLTQVSRRMGGSHAFNRQQSGVMREGKGERGGG
jgi:hypothetical protein